MLSSLGNECSCTAAHRVSMGLMTVLLCMGTKAQDPAAHGENPICDAREEAWCPIGEACIPHSPDITKLPRSNVQHSQINFP